MPFKIVKEFTPSNKGNILTINGKPKPSQGHSSSNPPSPFIDRLTVTVTVPEGRHGSDMYLPHIQAKDDKEVFKHATKSSGQYKGAYRLKLDTVIDAQKWPFYEFAFEDKRITRLRLDFVPVDLGVEGMFHLHNVLSCLVEGGWSYIVKHGRITRLDVAADFPDVQMDELHFLPKKAATSQKWSHAGKLQTFQHGLPNGNRTLIYDRKAKRAKQGKGWQNKTGIRIERRLINLKIAVHELPKLKNPFADFALVKRSPSLPPGEKKPYIWRLFLAACETMSMPAALSWLPVSKRTVFRKHLQTEVVDWLDIDQLWSGWPKMLGELKIAQPNAWH